MTSYNEEVLSEEDIYYLCAGESKESLRKGSIVSATIHKFDSERLTLLCKLENGLDAFLSSREINNEGEANKDEMSKITPGSVIQARVKEDIKCTFNNNINQYRLNIYLSIKPKDLFKHSLFIEDRDLRLDTCFQKDENDWNDMALLEADT